MDRENRHTANISRKTRAILNLTVCALIFALLCVCVIRDYLENPRILRLTAEEQFRESEFSHMVGPGKILDILTLDDFTIDGGYDRLILATTDHGVETYLYDSRGRQTARFNYREKHGDITVLSVPYILANSTGFVSTPTRLRIPVLLFDSHPQAVRAEVNMELSAIFDPAGGKIFRKTYNLKADRTAAGYFLLELSFRDFGYSRALGEEARAFYYLTDFSKGCEVPNVAYYEYIPIHVRLFDKDGNVVCTEYIELRTPAGDARLERGEDSW